MNEELLGYLFESLEPAAHTAVEKQLHDSPELRQRLELLRQALAPLEADRDDPDPPTGLVERTVARVAEFLCRDGQPAPLVDWHNPKLPFAVRLARVGGVSDLPRPQLGPPSNDPIGPPSRWRRLDVVVAASLLFLAMALGLPALSYWQQQRHILTCQDNLRGYHQALAGFSEKHDGQFPLGAGTQHPLHLVPLLRNEGFLAPDFRVSCPASQEDYAYTLGYHDAKGNVVGLGKHPELPDNDLLPILADAPPRPLLPTTMGGPHGYGVNVLSIGGNVRFSTSPLCGVARDHIYFNQANRVSPGLHRLDTVLSSAPFEP